MVHVFHNMKGTFMMFPMRRYFDYNANAPLYEVVIDRITMAFNEFGSASAIHGFGRRVNYLIEEARAEIAGSLEAQPQNIVFTSGASEANNMVLQGFESQGYRILVSAIEHASCRLAALNPELIPVTNEGVIDLAMLEKMISSGSTPTLIAVMAANNETGVIQPINEVVALAKKYGALVHTDAVQALGRIPVSFESINVDSMVISSHKIGGPLGVGALIMKEKIELPPFIRGAGQEKNRRSGTQNMPGIVGFATALKEVLKEDWQRVEELRNWMEKQIKEIADEGIIFGEKKPRLQNTSFIRMPGVKRDLQMMAFDLEGFAVSPGSACSSGKSKASHTLLSMGVPADQAEEAVRLSFSPNVNKSDIKDFVELWHQIYQKKRLKK